LRYTQPQTFQTLMLGERSWLFDLVALLFGLLIVFASGYVLHYVRGRTRPADAFDSFLPISLAVVILAALVLPLPYHLQHIPGMHWLTDREINPLGKMQPNKYLALAALVTFGAANFIVFLRSYVTASKSQGADRRERAAPILLIALAVCSILILLGMGWVR